MMKKKGIDGVVKEILEENNQVVYRSVEKQFEYGHEVFNFTLACYMGEYMIWLKSKLNSTKI